MTDINVDRTLEFIKEKWKNRCPMCDHADWHVQNRSFELREFQSGSIVIGGAPVIPVIPITCGNCGTTIIVNAFVVGAIERENEKEREKEAEHEKEEKNEG